MYTSFPNTETKAVCTIENRKRRKFIPKMKKNEVPWKKWNNEEKKMTSGQPEVS